MIINSLPIEYTSEVKFGLFDDIVISNNLPAIRIVTGLPFIKISV